MVRKKSATFIFTINLENLDQLFYYRLWKLFYEMLSISAVFLGPLRIYVDLYCNYGYDRRIDGAVAYIALCTAAHGKKKWK